MTECEALQERCRCEGTSFAEKGKRVSIDRRAPEEVSFFRIDDDGVRGFFKTTGRLPDVLVLYRASAADPRTAIFVELKGGHLDDAMEQLTEACRRMRRCIEDALQPDRWLALVVLGGGGAPEKTSTLRRRFEKECGMDLEVASAKVCDLRRFVRR